MNVVSCTWEYNILQHTALADTRNLAAHGKWDELKKEDVERMVRDIEDFMRQEFERAKAFLPTKARKSLTPNLEREFWSMHRNWVPLQMYRAALHSEIWLVLLMGL